MNNFELHEQAQELADTRTAYSLAREFVELQNDLPKIKADAVREAAKETGTGESRMYMVKLFYYADKIERGEL